jgi:hypothetical protein
MQAASVARRRHANEGWSSGPSLRWGDEGGGLTPRAFSGADT